MLHFSLLFSLLFFVHTTLLQNKFASKIKTVSQDATEQLTQKH